MVIIYIRKNYFALHVSVDLKHHFIFYILFLGKYRGENVSIAKFCGKVMTGELRSKGIS